MSLGCIEHKRFLTCRSVQVLTRISHLDPADLPESRGNAGETPAPFFHPSRPSGFGYLVHRNSLTQQLKSGHGAGRTPVHLGNPGLTRISQMRWLAADVLR